ncbi:MAG: hypothetical protein CO129_04075 [Ignavibacteriales bacterium CG_4_9_14_3_um_filter_34_10]|nr:MAG: hypothetical protein CO129_04075 [Ignavibacteriales bacterium CG_4_9_14_3_um_filter_34_10]
MIVILFLFVSASVFYFAFLIAIGFGLKRSNKYHSNNLKTVTVIIPFRNESANIAASIQSIKSLNYPKDLLEVIYINDNSTDDSVTQIYDKTNENIKLIHNDDVKLSGFKKNAIQKAIQISKGEIIVLTDADCIARKNWINAIVNSFDENTGMVVGPVKFRASESLFSKLQQLEFAGLMLTAAGLIGINKPIICSAANLAFRKNIFSEVGGYSDNLNLTSGDDEILMQKINSRTNYKISFCWSADSLVETRGNESLSAFFQQRTRWASKSLFYQNKLLIISLFTIYIFYFLLTMHPFLFLIQPKIFFVSFITSLFIKFILELLIMLKGRNLLFDAKNLKYFVIAELLQIPYITIAAISGAFGNYKWKDRKVKR